MSFSSINALIGLYIARQKMIKWLITIMSILTLSILNDTGKVNFHLVKGGSKV